MNKQVGITIAGLLGICLGVVVLFQGATELYDAEINGIFGYLSMHSPTQKIAAIICPLEWADNKPGVVNVTVQNPLSKPLNYTMTISTFWSFSSPPQAGPSQLVTIPANEQATISWTLDPPASPAYFVFAQVYATSDEDAAKSKTTQYHMWPSSYQGTCGIRLINNPAFATLRLRAMGGVLAILFGGVLAYVPNRPLRGRNQRIAAAIVATLVVVTAGAALYYIFLVTHPISY